MKGKLTKLYSGWVVTYMEYFDSKILPYRGNISIPVHPYEKVDEDAEGSEVEFEIEDFWETGLEQVYKVAKLIKPEYQSDDKTWDEIFTEIEDSLHSPIPVRVKNWLKNKFETPIKK